MKKGLLTFFLLCAFSVIADEKAILTLREAFEKALVQSESLAIQEQTLKIAQAHYVEMLGSFLPTLEGSANELIQDTTSNSGSDSVTSTFTRRYRTETALTVTQPLFQGFREFAALRLTGAERQKSRLETKRARELLFADVAEAYYAVLQAEEEFRIRQSMLGTLKQRKEELSDRVNLGRSRTSETLSTESEIASTEAEIEKTKGLIATSRDLLGFLTGKEVTQKLADEFPVPKTLQPLEKWGVGVSQRGDLEAARFGTRMAKGNVDYTRGALFPFLDVTGNYYPYRTGYQKDIKWDVTFGLTVPLLDSGSLRGPLKEAKAELKQAELSEQETKRRATLELNQAYHNLTSSQAQEKSLKRGEAKAKETYESLTQEYNLSRTDNLDLLEGLKQWQEKRVEANEARFRTKLYYLQLLTASGQLPTTP